MDRHPDPVGSPFPLLSMNGESVMAVAGADVGRNREDLRRRRLLRIAVWVGFPALFLWWRIALGRPVNLLRMPHIDLMLWLPVIFFVVLILSVILPSSSSAARRTCSTGRTRSTSGSTTSSAST